MLLKAAAGLSEKPFLYKAFLIGILKYFVL